VYKAPFGYYKVFELKCLGHPLSELSRSFKPDFSVCQVYAVYALIFYAKNM
jgi:hypothetical protein